MRYCLEPKLQPYLSATHITVHISHFYHILPKTVVQEMLESGRTLEIQVEADHTDTACFRGSLYCRSVRKAQLDFIVKYLAYDAGCACCAHQSAMLPPASKQFYLPSTLIFDFRNDECDGCGANLSHGMSTALERIQRSSDIDVLNCRDLRGRKRLDLICRQVPAVQSGSAAPQVATSR